MAGAACSTPRGQDNWVPTPAAVLKLYRTFSAAGSASSALVDRAAISAISTSVSRILIPLRCRGTSIACAAEAGLTQERRELWGLVRAKEAWESLPKPRRVQRTGG